MLQEDVLKIPALRANKIQVLRSSGTVRLTFAEGVGTDVVAMRAAVCLSHEDALSMANLITGLLSPDGTKP